jgi:PBP1b-binding outer membrane lipoprotein LpoB
MKKLTLIAILAVALASCESVNNNEAVEVVDTQAVTVDTIASTSIDSVKVQDSVTALIDSASLKVSK